MAGADDLEDVDCPVCGGAEAGPVFVGRDRQLGHPGRFPYVRCRACGLVYQRPRPRDLGRYYEGGYAPHAAAGPPPTPRELGDGRVAFDGLAGMQYGALQLVTRARAGRLLDVGCGGGDFLAAAEAAGWDVAGAEPDPRAAAAASARLRPADGPRVRAGTLEQAAFPPGSFDVVTLWHVIEHLPDPVGTLREVARVLRPGGLCLVQTPRWGSLEARVFGSLWAGLDAPRHCAVFSRATLGLAAERAGLRAGREVRVTGYPLAAISLRWAAAALLGEGAGRRLAAFLHAPAVDALGRAALTPAEMLGLGSQLTLPLYNAE